MNMQDLPNNLFISHAYEDKYAMESLLRFLPQNVKPIIFPPITVDPDKMVSAYLIQTILDCDGVIYLKSSKSKESFWVLFERNYALQIGKPVFAFDIVSFKIIPEKTPPLKPPVFPIYQRHDKEVVRKILRFMREERYFDLFLDTDIKPGVLWSEEIEKGLKTRLDQGGYAVLFYDGHSPLSKWVKDELMQAYNYRNSCDKILVAFLETMNFSELPEPLCRIQAVELYQGNNPKYSTSPTDEVSYYPKINELAIELAQDFNIDLRSLDELIVNLYGLIFKNIIS